MNEDKLKSDREVAERAQSVISLAVFKLAELVLRDATNEERNTASLEIIKDLNNAIEKIGKLSFMNRLPF